MSETAAAPVEDKQYIPLSEINKHKSRDDLWVAINGKVYNVSKFIDEHPGGEEVLMDVAGKDCTQEFEDVGHSEYAVEILENMYVGDGDPSELKIRDTPLGVQEFDTDTTQSSGPGIGLFILAAIIAAIAFVYLKATH